MTTTTPQGGAMPRLSIMMFLQYAVWGLWLPQLGRYLGAPTEDGGLGFTTSQVAWIIGLGGSVGAVTAPFIAGQFADRYFRAERFLAFLLIAGGLVQILIARQHDFSMWIILAIVYSVLYMPTLSLSNSVTFANLTNPSTQFPKVRVLGTFGWIAAAWLFPMFWLQSGLQFQALPPFFTGEERPDVVARLIDAMTISGVVSMIYGLYCLTLPATPPKKDAVEPIAFKKAFALMRRPSVLVLIFSSLIIAMIHQIYFMKTGSFLEARGLQDSYVMPAMSVGQFAEIVVMAILGLLIKKLGFRWVIMLGALAYFGRYAIWSIPTASVSTLVTSQALHGFCYACFFAGTYIYIDKIAPKDVRNSAQTVIGIVILGLGPVLGSLLLPTIMTLTGSDLTVKPEVENYEGLWAALAGMGLFVAIVVAIFFREEPAAEEIAEA